MREIVYSQTSTGTFEPAPTRAQARQAKADARLKRERRGELVSSIVMAILIVLGLAGYAVSNLVAFGGWWVN